MLRFESSLIVQCVFKMKNAINRATRPEALIAQSFEKNSSITRRNAFGFTSAGNTASNISTETPIAIWLMGRPWITVFVIRKVD